MTHGSDVAALQVPPPGELTLDHVAHFVPESEAASAALARLGFTLTPFSAQSHRLQPDGPLLPAGTGNRCVMFERGYLEFLTPTADTPIAEQLRAAIRRYTGVHLVAFGTAAPDADHRRLVAAGFEPLPPVALQRPIETGTGEGLARFTVVRVPPGTMAEGRIQFCEQRTPELVWQERWIVHRNAATALSAALICVADPAEAARRYGRFTGIDPRPHGSAWALRTARGALVFAAPAAIERVLGVAPPAVPWIAGYTLESRDLATTAAAVGSSANAARKLAGGQLLITLPPVLGGVLMFDRPGAKLPNFD